ncbi:MAG TPA: hypothetical protein VG692_16380 [Gemmatimonadales bacterium]|nr:hypothetical protein [Gemmatimonadales bacterium]
MRCAWISAAALGTLLLLPRSAVGQDATKVTAPPDSAVRTAPVTYVTGSTIYVAAGRADGLVEGQQLFIKRTGGAVVTLKVAYLSSRQASCEVVGSDAASVVVGEQVTFLPTLSAGKAAGGSAGSAVAAPRPTRHRMSGPGLHGRVGARYLVAREETLNGGFSQPSFDLRLDGSALGGTPVGLSADLRTRRTTSTSGTGTSTVDGRTRVYQAALLWNTPGSGFRMALGRQYLTAVTSVTLFDGALMELNGSHLGFGAFAGVEPEPVNLGFSRDIQDFGGYFQLHNKPGITGGVWSFSLGAVGSYSSVATNREFAFAQATVSTPVVSLFALQELDYYRPWKVALGEDRFSLTSTYLNGSLRPTRWLSLNGGYDNRRSVRLYRDAVDPATSFDDTYRQGVNGGISLSGHRVRVSGDWRRSDGGGTGTATAWTGTLGLDRFTPLHLSLTGRGTWYSNPALDGKLYSGRVGFDPFAPLHLEFNGGVRNEDLAPTGTILTVTRRHVSWIGADLDWSLARGWFLSLSGTRERGDDGATTQFYGSMTWRF